MGHLVIALLLGATSPARAYLRDTAGDDGPAVFWPSERIEMRTAYGSFPEADQEALRLAVLYSMAEWSSAGGEGCTELLFVEGPEPESDDTNLTGPPDGENRIVWRWDEWPARPDALAVTTTAYNTRTGELIDADIDVNGVYMQWTMTDDPEQARYDVQSALTHELGHVLGLGHSDFPDATMFASSGTADFAKRDLSTDDIEGVCSIYPAAIRSNGLVGQASCSATGDGAPTWAWMVPLMLLLAERRALRR